MFCAYILGGTDGVGSRFKVLLSRTRFRRYRGRRVTLACFRRYRVRRVPSSCFALLDFYWEALRVMGLVIMFCAPGHIFGGTGGAGSRSHVLRS
jgi:hypothetical protein